MSIRNFEKMYKYFTLAFLSFWDLTVETMLAEDRVALNLLYTQAIWEVERGWVLATKDIRNKLSSLQSRGEKKEVICHFNTFPVLSLKDQHYPCLIICCPLSFLLSEIELVDTEIAIFTVPGNCKRIKVLRLHAIWRVLV